MNQEMRPYHHGNLKSALIEQGLLFLQSHPPEELSLRELARASGVSPNAPYRHFKTKEELLSALSEFGYESLMESFLRVDEDGPVKRFRAMGGAIETFASDHHPLFRLMFMAPSNQPQPAKEMCFTQLAESVKVLMDEPDMDEAVIQAAQAAWSLFFGFAVLKLENSLPSSSASAIPTGRDIARMFAKGLKG